MHKKAPIIKLISDQMKIRGYNRTTEEINTRIKNLKCLYNRIKKEMDTGHLQGSPQWKHFTAMHNILERPLFVGSNDPSSSATSENAHPELQLVDSTSNLVSCQIKQEKNDDESNDPPLQIENDSESDGNHICDLSKVKEEPKEEDIV